MSTKKTTPIQTNENSERHLIDGAKVLMAAFKTPANLLDFLTHSLYWMDLYNDKNKGDKISSSFIKLCISELVLPWLKNEDEARKAIISGLKELQDFFGFEECQKNLSSLMLGLTIELEEPEDSDFIKKYFLMFATMYEIAGFISEYEMEIHLKREREKLEQAA